MGGLQIAARTSLFPSASSTAGITPQVPHSRSHGARFVSAPQGRSHGIATFLLFFWRTRGRNDEMMRTEARVTGVHCLGGNDSHGQTCRAAGESPPPPPWAFRSTQPFTLAAISPHLRRNDVQLRAGSRGQALPRGRGRCVTVQGRGRGGE